MSNKRIVFMTGAAGGMGEATVQRLIRDGYRVAAVDINAEGLDKLRSSVGSPDLHIYVADLTDEESARNVIRSVAASLGPIDIVVNFIGWTDTMPFVDETKEYWDKVVGINFWSVCYVCHEVIPSMIERQSGKIINVTSDAGKVGQSREAVYSAMKGAVMAFSKSLARELVRYKITVNCTAPGPTDTPLERAQDPEIIKRVIRAIPFRRWAAPEEQAGVISFMCSQDSDYMTGQVISVSGGLTMI